MSRSTLAWNTGNSAFAIDRRQVVAVLDAPVLAPIPFAPSWLRGVCNRYGRAVAVIDCGQLAGDFDEPAPVVQVLVVPVAGAELGLAIPEPAVERLVNRGGETRDFYDRPDEADGVRVVSVERLVHTIAEWLGGTPGT